SALGATFEAADKYGWTLIHPISANANPSGTVTDDAFEQIGGPMLQAAQRQKPIDGVLLHLHGAMVVDSYEDGEGELLARLRRILGPDVPIRHARSPRQCDAADGRQCERPHCLPHLSAYRPIRARLAGRRFARARDEGRSQAEDRHRAPADDL